MEPIPYGYYDLADVRSGSIGLLDVALAHEHMSVSAANKRLAREAIADG